jgi:hypothetical protein
MHATTPGAHQQPVFIYFFIFYLFLERMKNLLFLSFCLKFGSTFRSGIDYLRISDEELMSHTLYSFPDWESQLSQTLLTALPCEQYNTPPIFERVYELRWWYIGEFTWQGSGIAQELEAHSKASFGFFGSDV